MVHGKIIVHDRNRVQAEVLPVYFNHASFASLRRQLSYFSFVRLGKSRQTGVTYTNDAVVELSDIRRLKRRSPSGGAPGGGDGGSSKRPAPPEDDGGPAPQPPKHPKRPKKELHPQQEEQRPRGSKERARHRREESHGDRLAAATSAADVASAVLSGTLHAAKTNDNLDNAGGNGGNAVGAGAPEEAAPAEPRAEGESSISQSISRNSSASTGTSSSSSSSDNEASKGSGGKNKSGNKGGANATSRKAKKAGGCNMKAAAYKRGQQGSAKHHLQQQHPAAPGGVLPRKDRKRLDRLLSINNIVPFIHLPEGRAAASSTATAPSSSSRPSHQPPCPTKRRSVGSVGTGNTGSVRSRGSDLSQVVVVGAARALQRQHQLRGQKENEPSPPTGGMRDRASSDCAIDALLSMGGSRGGGSGDRQ